MKTCTKCNEAKPLDAFASNGRGGHNPSCKACKAAQMREYRRSNRYETKRATLAEVVDTLGRIEAKLDQLLDARD